MKGGSRLRNRNSCEFKSFRRSYNPATSARSRTFTLEELCERYWRTDPRGFTGWPPRVRFPRFSSTRSKGRTPKRYDKSAERLRGGLRNSGYRYSLITPEGLTTFPAALANLNVGRFTANCGRHGERSWKTLSPSQTAQSPTRCTSTRRASGWPGRSQFPVTSLFGQNAACYTSE